MAIDVDSFKAFMGWSSGGSPGSVAIGLLRITKANPSDQSVYNIRANQDWSPVNSGLTFYNPEGAVISESAKFVVLAVESKIKSERYNIGPNLSWPVQQNLIITNPAGFAGGAKPIDPHTGLYPPSGPQPPDARLEAALNLSKQLIKGIKGLRKNEVLDEDDPAVIECCYLYAAYRVQNSQFWEMQTPVPSGAPTSAQLKIMFRDRAFRPLMAQIFSILGSQINWARFLNEKPEDEDNS